MTQQDMPMLENLSPRLAYVQEFMLLYILGMSYIWPAHDKRNLCTWCMAGIKYRNL